MSNNTLQKILKLLESEITSLKNEIDFKNKTIENLDKLIIELRKYNTSEEYKELYEKEKERLLKLHTIYTQIESERNILKKKLEGWEKWFSLNKKIFDKLFSNAPPEEVFSSRKKQKKS